MTKVGSLAADFFTLCGLPIAEKLGIYYNHVINYSCCCCLQGKPHNIHKSNQTVKCTVHAYTVYINHIFQLKYCVKKLMFDTALFG